MVYLKMAPEIQSLWNVYEKKLCLRKPAIQWMNCEWNLLHSLVIAAKISNSFRLICLHYWHKVSHHSIGNESF